MADPELAALRAARLTQLQQSGTDGSGQNGASSEDAEKRRAEEQMRQDLLATALESAARERRMSNCLPRILCGRMANASTVSRIALVSPTRSKQIESILLRMLQAGQLRGRVSEQQLIDLLEQVRLFPLDSYINAFVNYKFRQTKHRKRPPVRVPSWYVLIADNSRPGH